MIEIQMQHMEFLEMTDDILAASDRGRAGLYLAGRNAAIIGGMAAKRQRIGAGDGERAPGGMGAGAVSLSCLSDAVPGTEVIVRRPSGDRLQVVAGVVQVTTPGARTAVRNVARILAVLSTDDPRRRAADLFAGSYERIGAAGGGGGEGSAAKGGNSDGGVTTRIKHAERLRMIEARVNGWAVDPRHGRVVRGPERVALPVTRVHRSAPDRKEIKAFPLLVSICVDGHDMAQILEAHGWKAHSDVTRKLIAVAWEILDDIADAVGFGRFAFNQGD